jgi:hypothetical protein
MGQTGNIFLLFVECATICNFLQPVHFLKHALFATVFYLSQVAPFLARDRTRLWHGGAVVQSAIDVHYYQTIEAQK